jgi:hypothetical protein
MNERRESISGPQRAALVFTLATGLGAGSVITPEQASASTTLNPAPIERVLDQQGCPPYLPPEVPGAYEINLMIEGCLINEVQDINAANFAAWQASVANIWARRRFTEQIYFQQLQQPAVVVVPAQQPVQPVFVPAFNPHRPQHGGQGRGHGHGHGRR